MAFNFEGDTLRGNMGTLDVKIGDEVHSVEVLSFTADLAIADISRAVLGNIVTQHKSGLMDISGSMEIYSGNPLFLKALKDYKLTGKQPPMAFTCRNDDVASDLNPKAVTISNIKFTAIPLTVLNVNEELLQDTLDFVGNNFDIQ